MNKLKKAYNRIIKRNYELVDEYNMLFDDLELIENDILFLFNKICNINNSKNYDISIIISAIREAVDTKKDVLYILNKWFTEKSTELEVYNTTQQYFKEIGEIYEKHNNNYDIEYCEENRDKIIEMNLKTVIHIAKRFQGLGLSLPDLIQAGNVGLCVAFDKYNPYRSELRNNILQILETNLQEEDNKMEDIKDLISIYLSYGKLSDEFSSAFTRDVAYSKKDVIKWVNNNVKVAKFNSVASLWIEAYIKMELDNYSRVVKKPKSEIQSDRQKHGCYKTENYISIDYSDPEGFNISDTIADEAPPSSLEMYDNHLQFRIILNKLNKDINPRYNRILMKRFGIGYPRPVTPKEIAEEESLSVARVSQILQSVITKMKENADELGVDMESILCELYH